MKKGLGQAGGRFSFVVIISLNFILCFDAVGWVAGGASAQ